MHELEPALRHGFASTADAPPRGDQPDKRYYVGKDRERSPVTLFKKIDEHRDVSPGITGWVVKPVEIDDVPIVNLAVTSSTADDMTLRTVAKEIAQRLATEEDVSRSYVICGRSRVMQVLLDPDEMAAHDVSPLDVPQAAEGANVRVTAGELRANDRLYSVDAGNALTSAADLRRLVIGVFDRRPVSLGSVARVDDGPEVTNFVRHGWGPAHQFAKEEDFPGRLAVAVAKKRGTNAVRVAKAVLRQNGAAPTGRDWKGWPTCRYCSLSSDSL